MSSKEAIKIAASTHIMTNIKYYQTSYLFANLIGNNGILLFKGIQYTLMITSDNKHILCLSEIHISLTVNGLFIT